MNQPRPRVRAKQGSGRRLDLAQLGEARRGYEGGATFGELGERFGLSGSAMRRLLLAVGVEPRGRGSYARAPKHKPPRPAASSLHDRSLILAPQQRVVEPTGAKVTSMQARLRRTRPPMVIAGRTPAERLARAWTCPELAAIALELRAGRLQRVARGVSARPAGATGFDIIMARQRAGIDFHAHMAAMRRRSA